MHNTIFNRYLYARILKIRGDNAMILFHPRKKLYRTEPAWLYFWWFERLPMHSKAERWVQGKNRTAHPDHGARFLGTIPATRSHPRPGYDTAFPSNL